MTRDIYLNAPRTPTSLDLATLWTKYLQAASILGLETNDDMETATTTNF